MPPPPPPSHTATPTKLFYGTASPSQYILLYTPQRGKAASHPAPLVIFLHGGFWKSAYSLCPPTAGCDTLPSSLTAAGYAAAFVEYRRSGDPGGWGWPHTNADVLAAYAHLHARYTTDISLYDDNCSSFDASRIVVIGHSAGGTLALWLAAHLTSPSINSLPIPTPDSRMQKISSTRPPPPYHTIALAPVSNLPLAATLRLSDAGNAIQNYLHTHETDNRPATYAPACPTAHAKTLATAAITLALGDRDDQIPREVVTSTVDALLTGRSTLRTRKSLALHDTISNNATGAKTDADVEAARLPPLHYLLLPNTDHFTIANASTPAWATILSHITAIINANQTSFPSTQ